MTGNIFLTGFSGSGKTTVGRDVARTLGWRYVDTDDEIVKEAGKPIEAIFMDGGETTFRRLERDSLSSVCKDTEQVVSTGGGIVVDEKNRDLMERSGVVVHLDARPHTLHKRLTKQRNDTPGLVRPMLDAPDPLKRITTLKADRQASYALAHWTVHTDSMTPAEVASEVVRGWRTVAKSSEEIDSAHEADLAGTVRTATGDYPVWVGWGILPDIGERVKALMSPGAAYVVTDQGAQRHGRRVQVAMEGAGIPSHLFILPSGEQHKTLETATHLYDWLAQQRAERGHMIVAVGGGVVGDIAGFVAATFLRGIAVAHVPTTLLAMMDASIGGKTGVDLSAGKNLVGAFHQPAFVLSDVETLTTLPSRALTSGWAEGIKHGLILDEDLLRSFEERKDAVVSLDPELATDIVRRSVAVKADVVSKDEKETLGLRVLLNYGHTIGHALEAATGYDTLMHGEAVSIGMMGAAEIARALGTMSDADIERQRAVLEAYGLPVKHRTDRFDTVREAMGVDKKTSGGSIRWVLVDGIGRAVTRNDVPPNVVDDALRAVLS